MAAPVRKMVSVSDDSSSSDDEALKRCQEAVWETRPVKEKGDNTAKQSKRVVVADHEHDGNELQVSQGFRTHVAKKLEHLLDSSFTETKASSCVELAKHDNDDDDEGFRLFSTSVPGQTAEQPPAPVRRRPAPSSSDSDSEMERLREAAVSVKDLLPASALPPAPSPPSTEKKKKKKKKKVAEVEESHVAEKKRKQNQEEDSASPPLNGQRNGDHGDVEEEHTQVKVKRKKKKKRERNTEGDEALN